MVGPLWGSPRLGPQRAIHSTGVDAAFVRVVLALPCRCVGLCYRARAANLAPVRWASLRRERCAKKTRRFFLRVVVGVVWASADE